MEKQRILKVTAIVAMIVVALLGVGVVGIVTMIDGSVRDLATTAQQAHPHLGDDVAALLDFLNSDTHTMEARTRAAWALGRVRDPRALPALEAAYTGEPCDHATGVCQRELEKAIRRCGGSI